MALGLAGFGQPTDAGGLLLRPWNQGAADRETWVNWQASIGGPDALRFLAMHCKVTTLSGTDARGHRFVFRWRAILQTAQMQ